MARLPGQCNSEDRTQIEDLMCFNSNITMAKLPRGQCKCAERPQVQDAAVLELKEYHSKATKAVPLGRQ